LIELAKAWAVRGDAARAREALAEAQRIALPGSDRRGKTRWLGGQAVVAALSRGEGPARALLDEARATAGDHWTLNAELAFIESTFVGASPRLQAELPALARQTGIARVQLAAALARQENIPHPDSVEDGLSRVLLRFRSLSPAERIELLVAEHLLGLVPRALGEEPGRRLLLLGDTLVCEDRGVVTAGPAPVGPSRRVLSALGAGFQSRESLAERVWGLRRYNPSKHSAVINTAMSRLRAALAEPTWVVTHEDGYHLATGIEVVAFGDEATTESSGAAPPPPAEEVAVLDLLRTEGPSSSAEVARVLEVSSSSALRTLRRMVEDGRVRRVGSGRATRYALAETSADDP
jgi:hypothetical protein